MGLEFDPLIPGDPKLKGEFLLRTMLGISLSHSKWWDLAAVLAIAVSYRLLFLAVLKLKEQGSPPLLTLYTNKILQLLRKRQKPCLSSERHHPPYSLSSQEGFSSPIVQSQQEINHILNHKLHVLHILWKLIINGHHLNNQRVSSFLTLMGASMWVKMLKQYHKKAKMLFDKGFLKQF